MGKKGGRKPELKVNQITHPNSRKAKKIVKVTNRVAKRKVSKVSHHMKLNLLGEKLLYFQDNLVCSNSACTRTELRELIEKYLSRFADELEQIKLKNSIGQRYRHRPNNASREAAINMTLSQELEEYSNSGIELPDLLSASQVKMLKEWNGKIVSIQHFKFRRFTKKFLYSNENEKSEEANMEKKGETGEMVE